jgi:tetratricopeptide (TPR) repeat protein
LGSINGDGTDELTAETIITAEDVGPRSPEILYRSDHLEVRRIAAGDGRHQAVTFESYHDDTGFDRIGFGETFFERAGLTAIHVLTVGNDWYQYPEIEEALAAIRKSVSGAERVLAYGSSMGGYAAVRFADAIGATHVLSLSPQYSIDPKRVAADRRWWWDQKRIAFMAAHNGPITCSADIVVAYDPTIRLDDLHGQMIGRDVPTRFLKLTYAGHPVTTMLNELSVLRPLALAFANEDLDLAEVEIEIAERREQSAVWLTEYGARALTHDGLYALDLAERAVGLAPASAAMQHQHGMRLHDLGRYEEAIAAHRRAVATERHPIFMLSLSRSLFFSGQYAEALSWVETAQQMRPFDDFYFHSAARIRLATGDRRGAWRDAWRAVQLAKRPRNLFWLAYYAVHRVFG